MYGAVDEPEAGVPPVERPAQPRRGLLYCTVGGLAVAALAATSTVMHRSQHSPLGAAPAAALARADKLASPLSDSYHSPSHNSSSNDDDRGRFDHDHSHDHNSGRSDGDDPESRLELSPTPIPTTFHPTQDHLPSPTTLVAEMYPDRPTFEPTVMPTYEPTAGTTYAPSSGQRTSAARSGSSSNSHTHSSDHDHSSHSSHGSHSSHSSHDHHDHHDSSGDLTR